MSRIQNLIHSFRRNGAIETIRIISMRIFRIKHGLLHNFNRYQEYFSGKYGLEIGGPTPCFLDHCPVYPLAQNLDNVNFSTNTAWEKNLADNTPYSFYENRTGTQYIREASSLTGIPDGKYDFVLASHCLEHCANAIKTTREWLRVLKPGGVLLLVLPERHHCFDHRRSVTSFEHLLADEQANIDETDLTHLDEILELHDLAGDLPAGTPEQFKQRSLQNFQNRCLHHHVFDLPLLKQLYRHLGVQVIDTDSVGVSQYILGRKQ